MTTLQSSINNHNMGTSSYPDMPTSMSISSSTSSASSSTPSSSSGTTSSSSFGPNSLMLSYSTKLSATRKRLMWSELADRKKAFNNDLTTPFSSIVDAWQRLHVYHEFDISLAQSPMTKKFLNDMRIHTQMLTTRMSQLENKYYQHLQQEEQREASTTSEYVLYSLLEQNELSQLSIIQMADKAKQSANPNAISQAQQRIEQSKNAMNTSDLNSDNESQSSSSSDNSSSDSSHDQDSDNEQNTSHNQNNNNVDDDDIDVDADDVDRNIESETDQSD